MPILWKMINNKREPMMIKKIKWKEMMMMITLTTAAMLGRRLIMITSAKK